MAGGGLPAGATITHARDIDIAPTLLHALGHAVARDMDGRVVPVVARATYPRAVEYVDSYDPAAEQGDGPPLTTVHDEAILEKLRALGYIDDPETREAATHGAGEK